MHYTWSFSPYTSFYIGKCVLFLYFSDHMFVIVGRVMQDPVILPDTRKQLI